MLFVCIELWSIYRLGEKKVDYKRNRRRLQSAVIEMCPNEVDVSKRLQA